MPAPKIQIAFQGGGAKFLAMLPICHALSQCEAEDKIQISAVAGTSAGSICAALVAAKCDFERLRTYIAANGKAHLGRLIDPDVVELAEMLKDERISLWKLYRARAKISKVLKDGAPVLNEVTFGNFLDELLGFCIDGESSIENLTTRLYITATNLAKASGITHVSGSIKSALRDSCALPILFRSFAYLSINHNVDGGLCNNLPVECLLDDASAPLFAVFAEETLDKTPVRNIFQYLLSLFDASITHNTERSKDYIYDPFRIPVRTNYSTFSFSEALNIFSDEEWYNKQYLSAYNRVIDFVTNYGEISSDNHYRFIDTKSIADYIASLENATCRWGEFISMKYSGILVRLNCGDRLTKIQRDYRRSPDNVTRIVKFEVMDEKFRYYRSTVSMDEGGRPVPTVWRAKNETTGKELPIRVLSLEKLIGPNKLHVSCVVEILKPESFINIGDMIEVTDTYSHKDGMLKLNLGKNDELRAENLHGRVLDVVEITLSYPRKLGTIDVEFDASGSTVAPDSVKRLTNKEVYDHVEIAMRAENVPSFGTLLCRFVHK